MIVNANFTPERYKGSLIHPRFAFTYSSRLNNLRGFPVTPSPSRGSFQPCFTANSLSVHAELVEA